MLKALTTGLLTGLFISFSVGYVVFAIIRYSLNRGPRAGISFVLGVNMADLIFVMISLWAATFMQGVEKYQKEIGLIGSIVFVVIGFYGIFKKENLFRMRRTRTVSKSSALVKIWLSGIMLNLLNPGAVALWLSVNLAVVGYTLNEKIVFFSAILFVTLSTDLFKVFLAGLLRKSLTIRTTYYLNKISAGMFILLGIGLFVYSFFND